MKRIFLSVLVLSLAFSSAGCLCNPCGGAARFGGACGLGYPMGVSYIESVGPAACTEDGCGAAGACDPCSDCGPCGTVEPCFPYGTGGVLVAQPFAQPGGYGPCFPILAQTTQGSMMVANGIGQLAVGIVALPFKVVGGILNYSGCGIYNGCGCSTEAYYGDECAAGVSGCDPCGYAGGYPAGCRKCANGYTEGINPGEPQNMQYEESAPQAPTANKAAAVQPPRHINQVAFRQPAGQTYPQPQQQVFRR